MPTQLQFAVVAVFTGVVIACGGSVRGAPASPSVAVPRDGTHMDADGYDRVAQRILLMLS